MDLDELFTLIDQLKLYKKGIADLKDEIAFQKDQELSAKSSQVHLNVALNGIQAEFDKVIGQLKGVLG